MKPHRRLIAALMLVLGWIASVAFARAFLAPEVGAATVSQLSNSDSNYMWVMDFTSSASLATAVITLIFGVVIYLVMRSK